MYEKPSWYSALSQDHQNETKWVLDRFSDKLRWCEEESVLDIGCGPGDTTRNVLLPTIENRCSKLIGVDMSPEMVNYAKSNWSHPKLSYQVLDIASQEDVEAKFPREILETEGFDKIFSFFCLQWVKDQKRAAENMYKLLKPGGSACLLIVVRSGVYNVWDELAASKKWSPYLQGMNRPLNDYVYMDDYLEYGRKIMEEAGFVVYICEAEERKDVFVTKTDTDEEKIMRLRSVDPFIRKIPEDKKNEYLQELLEVVKAKVSPRGATDYTGLHLLLRKR